MVDNILNFDYSQLVHVSKLYLITYLYYLANTLDYRYCNAGNVGCSWYSTAYNTVDNYWEHSATSTELTECVSPDGCQVGTIHDSIVEQWNSVSDYGYITMDKPCNEPNGCHFNDATCTVPFMGIRCRIDGCNNEDILTGMNGDFKSCGSGSKSWDAATWDEDGSHSYNLNNNFIFFHFIFSLFILIFI